MKNTSKFALLYWFVAAFFYFYQYVLRVSGGLLTDTLMQDFAITASSVGTVLSVASFSYVFMQIPAGATTDYFGARWILPFACALCSIGCALFAFAESMPLLLVARVLIGIGAAYAFICTTKIIALYFKETQLPAMVSWTILIGSSGGLVGAGPLATLMQDVGWRPALFYVALFGLILGVVSLFLGKRSQKHSRTQGEGQEKSRLLEGLKFGIKTPQVLIVCAWGFCIYMPLCVFADTWGVPYLMAAVQCSKTVAAQNVSLIYLGLIVGCPVYGWLGTRFSRYDVIFSVSSFALIILFYLVFWQVALISSVLEMVMVLIGFFISVQLLMFPAAVRHVPGRYTASTVGLVNTATMISGAIFQKAIGAGVDWLWDGAYCEGVPVYGLKCYQLPLTIILLFMGCSFVISLFVKEKSISRAAS